MKKKGSALIVAMMLIAGVGAVAFGIGRLLFVETKTATLYENGVVAYYAAESGIEEGFLRYKFDRNVMIPGTQSPLLGSTQTNRTNLISKTSASSDFSTLVLTTDRDKQLYDLHINYLGTDGQPWHAHSVADSNAITIYDLISSAYATGDYSSLKINKDATAKVDLTKVDIINNSTKLALLFEKVPYSLPGVNTTDKCKAMAEIKLTIETGGATTREYKELSNYEPTACASLLGFSQSKLLSDNPADSDRVSDYNPSNPDPTPSLYYVIELQDILNRAGYTYDQANATQVTLSIRPLYYTARYAVYVESCNSNPLLCDSVGKIIPGPFTSIASRGYYGGVTRALAANVDRQSGTLYDLFDYVIFKEN